MPLPDIVPTHDEAVSQARGYATHQPVRAWSANGNDEFVLLGSPQTEEWSFFEGAHPNALLIGSETRVTAAMARAERKLRRAVGFTIT
jgi:hypothetical protein